MEETNSRTQKQQIQKQLSPTHSGSGGLRGGGIRPRLSIRDETLVNFGKKLESRIGPISLFCLVTIATVLIINTIYHESANGTLVELIEGILKEILELQFVGIESSTTTTTSFIKTTVIAETGTLSTEGNESISKGKVCMKHVFHLSFDLPDFQIFHYIGKIFLVSRFLNFRLLNLLSPLKSVSANQRRIPNLLPNLLETSPTTKSTADSLRPIVLRRTEQISELNLYKERFHETDQKIILIILICILGILLSIAGIIICRRRGGIQASKSSRIAYGMILAAICLLLIIQLFMFIITLLPNAFAFHSLVDKLLDFYLTSEVPEDKRKALSDPIENNFGCKLKVEHQLLEQMGIQEPCAPKIKDRLLAPYIVLFLILIALSPFLYIIFIIVWLKKLKNVKPILNARQKVAASNEARMRRFKEKIENI
ncbi:unnamed protein product [Meloidogyne enterolobii]|uniref:Uncharacterized protein n=2 Tax=Meloidogyne enterolobii TaxID=390850 RepID=A0ACB1B895_MELEN